MKKEISLEHEIRRKCRAVFVEKKQNILAELVG